MTPKNLTEKPSSVLTCAKVVPNKELRKSPLASLQVGPGGADSRNKGSQCLT